MRMQIMQAKPYPLPSAQVAMLKDEGHFVSPPKWNIVQRLTLQRLKADLHGDKQALEAMQQMRMQKDFAEVELILDK